MRYIFFIFIYFTTLLSADTTLLIKKGWQLLGSSATITDMSKFNHSAVDQLWHFDAATQSWSAYSPYPQTTNKMADQNITLLTKLEPWHGFWIKSSKEWTLTLEESAPENNATGGERAGDLIRLRKGWNLLSLPVDTIISPHLFEGMTLWKYNSQEKWELFDENLSLTSYTSIGHLKNGEGFWVKSPEDQNITVGKEGAKLTTFLSDEALRTEIKERISTRYRPYYYYPITVDTLESEEVLSTTESVDVAVAAETSDTANTSQTNLQESGVDEADILKHDTTQTIFARTDAHTVSIYRFQNLVMNKTTAINSIQLSNDRTISDFYLVENTRFILSAEYGTNLSDAFSESYIYTEYTEKLHITLYDVSDPLAPVLKADHTIDGYLFSSRVHHGTLYTVTHYNPKYTITYPKITVIPSDACLKYRENPYPVYSEPNTFKVNSLSGDALRECLYLRQEDNIYVYYDYETPEVTLGQYLPYWTQTDGTSIPAVDHTSLYAASNQKETTTVTTISAVDIASGNFLKSTAYLGNAETLYASPNALYLVSKQYPYYYSFSHYQERSTIYKFALDTNLTYEGSGQVLGRMLNQFSMSEHNGTLRVATTEGFSWSSSGTQNSLFTLKQVDNMLQIQGSLSSLGKEGETIRGVRFIGDKGFVVTFRQTDPLYTLDLSDPTAPKKLGELEVNGYSAYLHPIGEDKLLGIGRDATTSGQLLGVKVELFDISDLSNPASLDAVTLDDNTYSYVESNHKALQYRASDQLFTFPYTDYHKTSLGIFQVDGNTLNSFDSLTHTSYTVYNNRGLIYDYNGTGYVSFFADSSVYTTEVNTTK